MKRHTPSSSFLTVSAITLCVGLLAATGLYVNAQNLSISSNVANAFITIREIFLSPSGSSKNDAKIILNGVTGNISSSGDLTVAGTVKFTHETIRCGDGTALSGCVLFVDSEGNITSSGSISDMNGNGEMYWAPTGLADADNPEDIFFGTKSEGGEETANMRIRVGLTSTAGGIGTLAEGNSIMTEKNIESRGGFSVLSDGNGDSHFKGTIVQGSDPHSQSKIENNDSGDLVIMNYTAKQVLTDLDFDTSKIVMKGYENNRTVFEVEGTARSDAFYLNSDARYKANIMKLNNSLDNLLSLHGYSYYNKLTKIQDIGVIAQEVEKVFPDLVQTNADGYKTVSYGNLVAPVIEAIRELSQKIDNLTASVSELFATYLDQQSQIDALEARLSQLEAK